MSSHVPFMTIAPSDTIKTSSTIDAHTTNASLDTIPSDALRDQTSHTSQRRSSISGTDSISSAIMPRSRLPRVIRFPLAVVLSLGLSAGLYSVVPDIAGHDLAGPSRRIDEPWQIGGLLGFKIASLALPWALRMDYWDVLNLTFLTHIPYYFFMYIFNEVPLLNNSLSMAVDLASLTVPFFLLRPLNRANAGIKHPHTLAQSLAADGNIRLYAAIFASTLYSLAVYASFYTWLPVYLITHFDSIATLEHMHNAALPLLITSFLPIGWAAESFLFSASIAASSTYPYEPFDPRTATLWQTVKYNLGLKGTREEVLAKRTIYLAMMTAANTMVRVWGTIEGSEPWGAAGWAGLFTAASLITGAAFDWIGDV